MMRSPRLTLPDAFTVRSTSVTSPAAGGRGGGPAGWAPAAARRARSRASRRDGRVLIRWPPSRTWTWAEARPEPDGPPGHRRPEPDLLPGDPEVARRRDHPVQLHRPVLPACRGPARRGAAAGPSGRVRGGAGSGGCPVSSAGIRSPIASPSAAVNRAAGKAMLRDWCGRRVL